MASSSEMDVDTAQDTVVVAAVTLDPKKITKLDEMKALYCSEIPADRRLPEAFWTPYTAKLTVQGMRSCILLYRASEGKLVPRQFQLESTLALATGKDSEVDAGTGSGKTLCLLLPALLSQGGISIVVSPLKQTQEAQVEELIRLGVSALAINEDTSKEPELWQAIEKCKFNILVVQPEQLSMHQGHWPKFARMIRKNRFTKHINYVHVDEAHFIHIAGINRHGLNAFRPAWGNLTQFRLKMPKRVHFQSLSGTQPAHIKKTIRKHLLFEEKKLHCRLDNLHFTTPDPSAPWPDDYQLEKGMIFHQTIEGCTAAAKHLNQRLPSSMQEKGVIRAFHAGMSKDYREQVMKDFRDPDGVCRQLHVTEIASTGIDIRDLAYVVQYGMTNEVPGTLQRGGRCGRDGVSECIFLIMHELSAKNIDLSRFGNDVWALDDPDQPHSGNLTDKSKKEQRIGVGMAKIVQSTVCLRELFAKANGDTTENALKYTGRFCCNRHPGNSFRFGAFFPGKMLYQQPETHKVFYGDADEPYGTELKAATIAADSESLKRARPKYRPTVLRPSLVHKLERWRYNAWRAHPLRSITPASFILNDSSIETLSKLTLDEHLLSVDDLTTALGQTTTWKNKYAHAIFKEIQLFEAEVLALNIKAKAEEEERQKRRKLEIDQEMFRKADEEARRRVREAALERAKLGPKVAPVPVQPASGTRRSARLAKPAAAASDTAPAAPAAQPPVASSSTATAAPSVYVPARLLPTAPHAHGNAFSSSTQDVTQTAAERVQSLFRRVQNKEITLDEMHKLLGAHTYTTPTLF
ncbi:II DNA helicase [Ephemerocybe angulata]|uniref:DNA 3'-5' helicase n=1 Tax=Ephemerocybe angulata TaxID=980116 RepID=A0A8H6IBD1_9AGAR|nr:II DNA helicase [Tulosesus angulatus]